MNKTETQAALDAAVLAHRADPTPENEAEVRRLMAERHNFFLIEQTQEFMLRQRGMTFH